MFLVQAKYTLNLLGFNHRWKARSLVILDVLKNLNADILCLQVYFKSFIWCIFRGHFRCCVVVLILLSFLFSPTHFCIQKFLVLFIRNQMSMISFTKEKQSRMITQASTLKEVGENLMDVGFFTSTTSILIYLIIYIYILLLVKTYLLQSLLYFHPFMFFSRLELVIEEKIDYNDLANLVLDESSGVEQKEKALDTNNKGTFRISFWVQYVFFIRRLQVLKNNVISLLIVIQSKGRLQGTLEIQMIHMYV